MAEITLQLSNAEMLALEELARAERRTTTEQAAQLVRVVLQERGFIKSDVNESQDEGRVVRFRDE